MRMSEDLTLSTETALDASRFFWGRHRALRALYVPVLFVASKEYKLFRFMNQPKAKRQAKLAPKIAEYEKKIDEVLPQVEKADIVGREKEFNRLFYSYQYHIMQDRGHGALAAPSKVFIVKGESGSGKTSLVTAFMREAYKQALRNGLVLTVDKIRSAEVLTKYMNESSSKLAKRFNDDLARPSIIFIDEAQQLAVKNVATEDTTGVVKDSLEVESELLQRLDQVRGNSKLRTIILFATDRYEALSEPIRRRAELIDLDANVDDERRVELAGRLCKKYMIDLDAAAVVDTIVREMAILGKANTTYSDITSCFEAVVAKAEGPIREGRGSQRLEIQLSDFKAVAPQVMSYSEDMKDAVAKDAKVRVRPDETYEDVGGLNGTKEKVFQEVAIALKGDLAGKMGYRMPKGFLFYGPPGTGKTLLAKAIANETKANFYYISAPSILNKWVGNSEKRLRDVFAEARRDPPSMLFIDEIDAIGRNRTGESSDSGVSYNVLTTLLTEMDGFNSAHGRTVVVAATNRIDTLDPALKERFNRHFEFTLPRSTKEKLEVIAVHMKRFKGLLGADVTEKSVFNVFIKKSFSPRVIADTLDLAAKMRTAEIVASREMLEATTQKAADNVARIYRDALERIKGQNFEEIAQAMALPGKWPITMKHIELAMQEVTKNEGYEEMLNMQRIYIDKEPRVGRAYGLSTVGETGSDGAILTVTANLYKAPYGEGKVKVYGNAGKGAQESAEMCVAYLRQYIPQICAYDVSVHIISAGEGTEDVAVSGPSAGQVIGVAIATEAIKVIRGVSLPVASDITFTGKIEQKTARAGWVGGIHPKNSAAKIDISIAEGFARVSVPTGQLDKLQKDYPEYVEMAKDAGTTILGAADLIDNLSYATGKSRAEISKLLTEQPADSGILTNKSLHKNNPMDYEL
jgi:transitional endoplasmic reticulum ATPase